MQIFNKYDPESLCVFYLANTVPLPPGKVYGCCFLKTWPTLLQGMISRLPPHCHTRNEISETHTHFGSFCEDFKLHNTRGSTSYMLLMFWYCQFSAKSSPAYVVWMSRCINGRLKCRSDSWELHESCVYSPQSHHSNQTKATEDRCYVTITTRCLQEVYCVLCAAFPSVHSINIVIFWDQLHSRGLLHLDKTTKTEGFSLIHHVDDG